MLWLDIRSVQDLQSGLVYRCEQFVPRPQAEMFGEVREYQPTFSLWRQVGGQTTQESK